MRRQLNFSPSLFHGATSYVPVRSREDVTRLLEAVANPFLSILEQTRTTGGMDAILTGAIAYPLPDSGRPRDPKTLSEYLNRNFGYAALISAWLNGNDRFDAIRLGKRAAAEHIERSTAPGEMTRLLDHVLNHLREHVPRGPHAPGLLHPDDVKGLLQDGHRFELVDGRPQERHMGIISSWIGGALYSRMLEYATANRWGWVYKADAGFTGFPRGNLRYPDVAAVRFGRFPNEEQPTGHAPLAPDFHEATAIEVEQAMNFAATAFATYRHTPGAVRAAFLERIATEIEALGDELLKRANHETGLPLARLTGERARTCGQLRLFAAVAREGSWVDARIDPALPDRQPLPRPDLRRMLVAIGPVIVFGSSNFPLAFSAAGGDTASALAADGPTLLHHVPDLADVTTLSQVLQSLGMEVARQPDGALRLEVIDERPCVADYELVRRMRASVCVLGPLVGRRKRACVSLPGGGVMVAL